MPDDEHGEEEDEEQVEEVEEQDEAKYLSSVCPTTFLAAMKS